MAKFLTTSGTSYYLEQLIINASRELILITPYLKLSPNFVDRIRDADSKGVSIKLIYGKDRLKSDEWYLLSDLKNISIFYCQDLHAKCYSNEKSMIISSMNFYQYSQENNREMGVLIDAKTDKEIYTDACQEIESIINSSVIEKSSGNLANSQNNGKEMRELDPDFIEKENFHIPLLHSLLKDSFPNSTFSVEVDPLNYSDIIVAEDFPQDGIRLEVDDRIFFHFDEEIKKSNWYERNQQLYEDIPEAKIYIGMYRLKLYWRERNRVQVSEQNLPIKANAYMDIIRKAVSLLN